MNKRPVWTMIAIAVVIGFCIGYVDYWPTWDDTGVTACVLLVVSMILALCKPDIALITGLATGLPVFLMNIFRRGGFESALGVLIALFGAFIGWCLSRLLRRVDR